MQENMIELLKSISGLTWIGIIIVSILILLAISAPYITPYTPVEQNLFNQHQPPSMSHPLGTDFFGRDILTRVLYGLRLSLTLGVIVVSINAVIGVILGVVGGYFGGWLDEIIMRITDIFLAFPTLLFALAIMAVLGQGFRGLIIAMTLKGWTTFARLSRSEVLAVKNLDYISSAHSMGASSLRIILSHVLPNIASVIFVYASLAIATPILGEAALSFLGLGVPPPTPSLGRLLAEERAHMLRAWWAVVSPGMVIMLAVLGFNLIGDGLRDILDPKVNV